MWIPKCYWEAEFELSEMVAIKRTAFPDKTLDYLFKTDEEEVV